MLIDRFSARKKGRTLINAFFLLYMICKSVDWLGRPLCVLRSYAQTIICKHEE